MGALLDELYRRQQSLQRWRQLWTSLIFVLGLAITVFLITSIFFFIRESWLPGALIVLGSLVSVGAMGWVKLRKDEAVREEQDALAMINFLKSFSEDPCRSGGRIESNH